MRSTTKYILLVALIAVTGTWSCKKWDEHNAVSQQALNETLLDQINKNASLSKFSEYLTKTGLDKVLSSSKNYTVFAPVNEAMAALPADVVSDTAKHDSESAIFYTQCDGLNKSSDAERQTRIF